MRREQFSKTKGHRGPFWPWPRMLTQLVKNYLKGFRFGLFQSKKPVSSARPPGYRFGVLSFYQFLGV